jgi:hypothetical protein
LRIGLDRWMKSFEVLRIEGAERRFDRGAETHDPVTDAPP